MKTQKTDKTLPDPIVSVVMPVYNCEKYVESALDSVVKQDYQNLEIIVINDGSTDKSREIILSNKDPRIKLLDNPGNKGIVYSRNRGIMEASGAFIAIMDSDDLLYPSKIRKQVAFFRANPGHGLCATYFERIGPDGSKLSENRKPSNEREAKAHLVLENFFCHSSIMFPAELLKSFQFASAFNLIEDYELFYRISRSHQIGIVKEILTSYRVHPNNISKVKRAEMLEKIKLLNRTILKDIGIPFTEEELSMHANFLYYNTSQMSGDTSMRKLKIWVEKLLNHIETSTTYNTPLNKEIILEKWTVACRNNGRMSSLLLSPLAFRYPATFLHILREKFIKLQHKSSKAA